MAKLEITSGSTSGLLTSFDIFLDDKNVGNMKKDSTLTLDIEPGTHTVAFKDTGMFKRSAPYEFTVANEETQLVAVNCGRWSYSVSLDFKEKN